MHRMPSSRRRFVWPALVVILAALTLSVAHAHESGDDSTNVRPCAACALAHAHVAIDGAAAAPGLDSCEDGPPSDDAFTAARVERPSRGRAPPASG